MNAFLESHQMVHLRCKFYLKIETWASTEAVNYMPAEASSIKSAADFEIHSKTKID